MTNRERWIVYPLLFFALLMGFKSNYMAPPQIRCLSLECQNLLVKNNLSATRINGRSAQLPLTVSPVSQPPRPERQPAMPAVSPPAEPTDSAAPREPQERAEPPSGESAAAGEPDAVRDAASSASDGA